MDDLEAKWWKEWWEADYSWEGLAKKPWEGWVIVNGQPVPDPESWPEGHENHGVRPEGARLATLQDYWRDEEPFLIECHHISKEGTAKDKFTRVHLPLKWQNGSEIRPSYLTMATQDEQAKILAPTLATSDETEFNKYGRMIGPDHRAQWQGAVLRGINIGQLVPNRLSNGKIPISLKAVNLLIAGEANFKNAVFSGWANFQNSIFSDRAVFEEAVFTNLANFDNTIFNKFANFYHVLFYDYSTFINSYFSRGVRFSNATFSGPAEFRGGKFSKDSSFQDTIFSMGANFQGAAFFGTLSFYGAQFDGQANFLGQDVDYPEGVTQIARRSFKTIDATGATFKDEAIFDNRDILEPSSFRDCRFFNIASFHGSKLHQGVGFHGAQFEAALDPKPSPNVVRKDIYYARLEDCFRTLKLAMENNRNRPEEARFFKLELKARAKRSVPRNWTGLINSLNPFSPAPSETHVHRWERWMSYIYGAVGDYGNSVMRPGGYVIGLTVICAFAYGMLGSLPRTNPLQSHEPELIEAFSFSLGRVIPTGPWAKEPAPCSPMGRLLNLPSPEIKEKENPASNYLCQIDKRSPKDRAWTALGINFLATLQSLIAIILVFLSALAARRRFQIS
jgi:hypothetical protein